MRVMVDLNCDMGESFGTYKIALDEEAVKYITSANIACGFHAGDPQVMAKTVDMSVSQGVGLGAHPGYPDLMGFGRRDLGATPNEVKNYIIYQVGALMAFANTKGSGLQHVKPHGALYNTAAVNKKIARAIAEALYAVDKNIIFMVLAGAETEKAAQEVGLRHAREVFADRNYNSDGTLVARSHPQSIIKDPAEAAKRMVEIVKTGRLKALDGTVFNVEADSICVHGDTPGAIKHMINLRQALEGAGIEVRPMGEFIK
ncbi:MAG TPA: 5-oxoprolinase subunit PxpA [Clostridia bacterium]|nr:5-oxoprolinase subunit PxpA [Clostridia bacterium]